MNEKEVAEIRRRFRGEKNCITTVHGCYVNEKREIVSQFQQSLATTAQEETENILNVLKRTLSGTLGKNLTDIEFATQQVVDSDEHRLLMSLRNSRLKDEQAIQSFYQRVIESLSIEGTYLILLAYDAYDVYYKAKDGETLNDGSDEVYSYILCSVCPVKMTKPVLSYDVPDSMFRNRGIDWLVAPPELGFLFPAFDDRSTNIYSSLYYTKNTEANHPEFVEAVFNTDVPMPAAVQQETFQSLLVETLAEDCSFDVVQNVHDKFCEMVEEHKASKDPEPLVVSKNTVKRVLGNCGVGEERMEVFEEQYDSKFGPTKELSPRNLVDVKKLQVCTPNVTISVKPERSDLLETRIIDGAKYILIRADEGVEVNGVSIRINE